MINRETVKRVLAIYEEAWQRQNSNLILSIFTNDAIYPERSFDKPYVGHSEIKQYWERQVVSGHANIAFELLPWARCC